MLEGLKGPPTTPDDDSPSPGVTDRTPEVGFTVKVTGRVVLPEPFVVFVKLTVS